MCFQFFTPTRHSLAVGIGVSVLTYAVDTGILYPPHSVLYKVTHHVRITLIKVGHGGYKPPILRILRICAAGMGVGHGGYFVAGLHIMAMIVKPCAVGSVNKQRVHAATMVEHHVLHHLHAALMGL